MPEEAMMSAWIEIFGSSPMHPRGILDYAIESNPDLLSTIILAVGMSPDHPHPDGLSAWLSKNENRFLKVGGDTYRFSRLGRRWRLLAVPPTHQAAPTEEESAAA